MASNLKKLVIVESPAKAKTINKILGKDYKVAASIGHIIDLPKTKLGIDIENHFKPEFETIKGKNKIIRELKSEAEKAEEILVATDPDREGEAIAFHIANAIASKKKKISRIEFNEITANAVLNAIHHPREIDMAKVDAQQARRVMDRIVGYQVSPFLWQTIFRGLSAGRVQSVALRLINEREIEIKNFNSIEYWNIEAILETQQGENFKARLFKIEDRTLDPQNNRIKNEIEARYHEKVLKNEKYIVNEIDKKSIQKKAPAPFITSTLQQEASRRLRMTTSRVMSIAQQLYEGIDISAKGTIGLITYMRTDSTRVSKEAVAKTRDYITNSYGPTYVTPKPIYYGSKKGAQDAHEAIRPTYINPEFEPKKLKKVLNTDQFKIYELIWKRFIASQMKPAKVDKTIVLVGAGLYLFKAEGEVVTFPGYQILYTENNDSQIEEENTDKKDVKIPDNLKRDDVLKLNDLLIEQKFTQPPPRYTESTLVKTLDKLGIGRPSTYAQIIATLFIRQYIEREKRSLIPTELGQTVIQLLLDHFPDIFNVKFTASMEENLDDIEDKKRTYENTLKSFYTPFKESLDHVSQKKKEIKKGLEERTEIKCNICGSSMVIKWGKNGRFYACSGFPKCRNTKPLEEQAITFTEEECDKCGSAMVVKRGRFGEFLACSNYPKCKNTKPISTGVLCPEDNCDGKIVQRQSKKGKIFYSCSNYPKCKFALWDKPVNEICSQCNYPLMIEKIDRAKNFYLFCPNCKYKKLEEELI